MKAHTTLFAVFSFSLLWSCVVGQDNSFNWQSFGADASREKLMVYKDFYDSEEVANWDHTQRIQFLKKGLDAAVSLGSKADMVSFSQMLGNRYHKADSLSQAIRYLKYPVEIMYDTISVARAYNRLGYIYFSIGDYTNSLKHFFESVKYGKLLNRRWETYPMGNITNVYKHLEDYDNAIKYTKASIALDLQSDFPEREYGLVYNYTNLLIFNYNQERTDSCLTYIKKINENIKRIDTIENDNYESAIHYAHLMIAEFYIDQDQLNLAEQHIDLAKAKEEPGKRSEGLLLTLGKYWLKKEDYLKVKFIIEEYENLNLSNFSSTEHLQELKINYYTAIEDYQSVTGIQKELLETQKEKFGDDRLRFSTFANAEYENLEQQRIISNLENQRALDKLNSRIQYYIFLIIFLSTCTIAIFWWYRNRINKQLNEYLDQEVQLKTKHLEQANYELRTFNYIASHDLKEPIRNIGNYANLIKMKLPAELQLSFKEYFNFIKASTKQLYTLIEDFAQYTSLSNEKAISYQEVDLNQLLDTIEKSINASIETYNGKIISNKLPKINSNASLIYIIFKNLIDNGFKFNNSSQPTMIFSYEKTNALHKIIVQDNGIGIEQTYFDKIFEMFTRLHERGKYPGSGIGLAIVQLLVKKLNGTIEMDSEIGKGSTFHILLPVQSKGA